jgi:hypothetical protein
LCDRRLYEPSPKHKEPKGYGTLCPKALTREEAQALLEVAVDDGLNETVLYAVESDWCFAARLTRRVEDGSVWHGYPILGRDVPEAILRAWRESGRIDRKQQKRLRQQRDFPKGWP